jgi:hypothetical protein
MNQNQKMEVGNYNPSYGYNSRLGAI